MKSPHAVVVGTWMTCGITMHHPAIDEGIYMAGEGEGHNGVCKAIHLIQRKKE